jgi:putative transposase
LGSRRLRETLRDEGHPINRKRVQRLMRQTGIAVLGSKPRGKPAPGHKVYPYLLGELVNMHKNAWLN